MSHRQEDENLIQWLRNLNSKVDNLIKDKKTRQNDIRLGDMVVTTDALTNEMNLRNLKTDEVTSIGQVKSIEWSYSGALAVAGTTADNSPPYAFLADGSVKEIVLTTVAAPTTAITVVVHLPGGPITATLPAGKTISVQVCNVPVRRNDLAYMTLTGTGTNGENLTVILRS